jgi:hypothetical protein
MESKALLLRPQEPSVGQYSNPDDHTVTPDFAKESEGSGCGLI